MNSIIKELQTEVPGIKTDGTKVEILNKTLQFVKLAKISMNTTTSEFTAPTIQMIEFEANISDQFTSTVQSPQVQHELNTFSTALQSEQLDPLI